MLFLRYEKGTQGEAARLPDGDVEGIDYVDTAIVDDMAAGFALVGTPSPNGLHWFIFDGTSEAGETGDSRA